SGGSASRQPEGRNPGLRGALTLRLPVLPVARIAMLVGTLVCAAASSDAAQQPNRVHTDTPVTSARRTTGIIHVDGRLDEPDWECLWDAAVTRTADAWIAEIVIPFKTLRFRPDQTVWGFNVERQIKHLFETDRWAAARVTSWIGNLADAGQLTGLEGARQGHG